MQNCNQELRNREPLKNKQTAAGFSLLETLVAISILVTAIVASLSLASQSISSASLSKNQIIAFNLAQEGMELVRSIRDTNSSNGTPDWLLGLRNCQADDGCRIDGWTEPLALLSCLPGGCDVFQYEAESGRYGYDFSGPDVIETSFRRKIRIEPLSDDEQAKVIVTVEWQEHFAAPSSLVLEERLFNWWPPAL